MDTISLKLPIFEELMQQIPPNAPVAIRFRKLNVEYHTCLTIRCYNNQGMEEDIVRYGFHDRLDDMIGEAIPLIPAATGTSIMERLKVIENRARKGGVERCSNCNMCLELHQGELVCPYCSIIQSALGGRTCSTYNPDRHYRLWIEHILGLEDLNEVTDAHMALVTREIAKLGIPVQMVTVPDIRKVLLANKLTKLNKNVSTILTRLTGIAPPTLSEEVKLKCGQYFMRSIRIHERSAEYARRNHNYYPFYIYKILDCLIPESDLETRRILFYIFLQSPLTLRSNDEDWKIVCKHIPELTFRSTDYSWSVTSRYYST